MSKSEINRFSEMQVFVSVVTSGNFSAAARQLEMTPSAVSKLIARLENRLQTGLLKRSTRQLQLTAEGNVFYRRSVHVLAELEKAEQAVMSTESPSGLLRVTTNVPIAHHVLLPLIKPFLSLYPELKLDLTITDHVLDLIQGTTDIAIRSGPLKDSGLTQRKLGSTPMVVVASPDYLAAQGIPKTPQELTQHNTLGFNFSRAKHYWPFQYQGQLVKARLKGNVRVSDGESLRHLVLQGVGIARLAAFQVREDIKMQRLVPILEQYYLPETEALHAVFLGRDHYVPMRVRVLVDFLCSSLGAQLD